MKTPYPSRNGNHLCLILRPMAGSNVMGISLSAAEALALADELDALTLRYSQGLEEDTSLHGLRMTTAEASSGYVLFSPYHKWGAEAPPCEIFLTFGASKHLSENIRATVVMPPVPMQDKEERHE